MTALLRLPELDKYELLEEIGHGGMATVFRARDRRLGREVAIKLIHRHLRGRPEVADRFACEARAVAKLRHDNIVEVYDVSDPDESESYLVVELVRGQTLRENLQRLERLPPEVAAALALEVGAGLEHAHRQGVVHRDVKPENVLLELHSATNDGDVPRPIGVKLTDFGIAKLLDAQGVTSTGEVLGSPAHMAPEQIEGGSVGPATDVFALGVLLYECMVGSLPFPGAHPAQVLRKVLDGDFVPPDRKDARIGSGYSQLVERALCRDPAGRFQSVEEMRAALTSELTALGYADTRPLLDQLAHPDPDFERDVCDRLIERGTRAKERRDFLEAAHAFGRALAYRPGDASLLRKVSGLARRKRHEKLSRGLLVTVLGGGVLGLAAWQIAAERGAPPLVRDVPSGGEAGGREPPQAAALPGRNVDEGPVRSVVAPRASPPPQRPPTPSPAAAAAARDRESPSLRRVSRPVATSRRPPKVRRQPPAPPEPVASEDLSRDVVVRITGAMGGTLRVDGQPLEWFGGKRHSLTLGPHRFAFVTPDSACCISTERTVLIRAGEGPQTVVGDIPFRKAILRVTSVDALPGQLACPTLFPGKQAFPGQRSVPMSRLRAEGDCVLQDDGPSSVPRKKSVTLRAGQTTVIQWP